MEKVKDIFPSSWYVLSHVGRRKPVVNLSPKKAHPVLRLKILSNIPQQLHALYRSACGNPFENKAPCALFQGQVQLRSIGFVHEGDQMSGIFHAGIARPFRLDGDELIPSPHNKVDFSPAPRPVMVELTFSQV
jgi:hypothetical protein